MKVKIQKAGIGINVVKSLNHILPRQALLTIYKSFIRPHLDYGDVFMTSLITNVCAKQLKVSNIKQLLQ